jgi:hypothetical protein
MQMCGARRDAAIQANSLRSRYCIRDLSPPIGNKQNVLTVNVTVKLNLRKENSRFFKRLQALDTIEWE